MIIVFKLTMFNYYCVSQPPDTFKKVANCVNYKIKLKQILIIHTVVTRYTVLTSKSFEGRSPTRLVSESQYNANF